MEYIESAALCLNAEVSLAALKSFQEILHISRDSKDNDVMDDLPLLSPPSQDDVISRPDQVPGHWSKPESHDDLDNDPSLWTAAWKVWLNIGTNATKPPDTSQQKSTKVYIPSQPFLTALIQTFPVLFEHIKTRFVTADFHKLSTVLKSALSVPVHGDASPFIIPSYPDVTITPLQEATLCSMESLMKVSLISLCDWSNSNHEG